MLESSSDPMIRSPLAVSSEQSDSSVDCPSATGIRASQSHPIHRVASWSVSWLPLALLAMLFHRCQAQPSAPFRLYQTNSGLCLRYRFDPQAYTGVVNWVSVYPCSSRGTDPYEYWFFSCPTCHNIQSVVNAEYLQCGSGLVSDIGSENAGYCYLSSGFTGVCQQNFHLSSSQGAYEIVNECYNSCVDGYDDTSSRMAYLYTCAGYGNQIFATDYLACPPGQFIQVPAGASVCSPCPKNFYCTGNNEAIPCATGS